jgi:type II secretory pathway component PulK
LGVSSQFFGVLAEAEIDNRRRVLKSVIAFDEEANAYTITRDWSQQWQANQQKNNTQKSN